MRETNKRSPMTPEEVEEARLILEKNQKRIEDELTAEGVTDVQLIDGHIVFIRPWIDAVADAWEDVLREQSPGTAWRVTAPLQTKRRNR